MATYKKQLKDKNGNTIYPDVGIDLGNVVYSDDPTTPIGDIIDPYTYSTTETRIGTWINGKPIYRRVITTTSPSAVNVATRVVDITGWNLETLVRDYFQITNPTYNITSSSNSDNVIAYMRLYAQPDNIGYMVNVRNSSYLSKPIVITLEYTKSTD